MKEFEFLEQFCDVILLFDVNEEQESLLRSNISKDNYLSDVRANMKVSYIV